MSELNEEYKEYLLYELDNIKYWMKVNGSPDWKMDYIKHRITNIMFDNPEFDHGYDPKDEWIDFPEANVLKSYNKWLNDRRERRIDSVCES